MQPTDEGFEGGKVLWPSEWTEPHDRDEKVRKQYPIWAQIPPEQLRIEPGRRHQYTGRIESEVTARR